MNPVEGKNRYTSFHFILFRIDIIANERLDAPQHITY